MVCAICIGLAGSTKARAPSRGPARRCRHFRVCGGLFGARCLVSLPLAAPRCGRSRFGR